jgi:hypothetical protein
LRPKHVEWLCRNKICTVLHQVGVSFDWEPEVWDCLRYLASCKQQKVKLTHYSPGQTLRVSGGLSSQYLQTLGTWRWQSFQLYTPAPFTAHEILPVLISVGDWVDPRAILRQEGLSQWKISMTPSGIEPAIFRLLAQWPSLMWEDFIKTDSREVEYWCVN